MTLADYFRPKPTLACPANGRPFGEWEGFGARGDWLVFEEGRPDAVDARRGAAPDYRLPDGRHSIFSEAQGVRCIAHIEVRGGVWASTVLSDCDGAEPVHLSGDFYLWPIPGGRACISGLRPQLGRLVRSPVITVGVNPTCIVAARRRRDARESPQWHVIDVAASNVLGPFDDGPDWRIALEERGFDVPRLTSLETVSR